MSGPLYKNNDGYDTPPAPDLYKTIYDPPYNKPQAERITDEELKRSAEEIRAEVARIAPHWRRYEQERADRRAAVAAENAKYPGILHGLDEKPFRLRSYDEVMPWKWHYIPDTDLRHAQRARALEEAKFAMPKYVLNPDGTIEVYSLEVHGPLRKCHLVKPERNTSLLTNTPAGRIHAATLSGNKSRILVAWEKYGTVVGRRNQHPKSSLWQRFCYWLRHLFPL